MKTAFLERHKTGRFVEKRYASTRTEDRNARRAGTDAFLVMFDLTSRLSYKLARRFRSSVPVVLVGAKAERDQVALHRKYGIPYVEVSYLRPVSSAWTCFSVSRRIAG